jgi:hypothetical protein
MVTGFISAKKALSSRTSLSKAGPFVSLERTSHLDPCGITTDGQEELQMSKFCANGHQMEDAWELCPFCQKTGYAGAPSASSKTRVDTITGPVASPATAPPPARKTVLISEQHKAPVVGWLVAMSGRQKGQDFRIRDGQNILGSALEADVQLNDPTVSGKHASLRYKEGKFYLVDLDSSNGTFLNDGTTAIAREELKDNDVIRAGELVLKFKCL